MNHQTLSLIIVVGVVLEVWGIISFAKANRKYYLRINVGERMGFFDIVVLLLPVINLLMAWSLNDELKRAGSPNYKTTNFTERLFGLRDEDIQ